MFRWRVCYIHGQEERRIIDLSNYDKVRLALKQEEILKPIAKENLSKAGKGLPILARLK